ncbi:MAG TPA: glycosyltransferase [Nitrospirota bacterium]|nr:glycosyltransferase [Nitrospirota bacterium]
MKIVFLIRSLEVGGAEQQLVEMSRGFKLKGHDVSVLVFYPGGLLTASLAEAGIPVIPLEKKGRWDVFAFMNRLFTVLRDQRAEYLYAFLGVSCILSVIVKRFIPKIKIVWGVRAGYMDLAQYDFLSRLLYRLECRLSRYADLIIANSHAGREYAIKKGFPSDKTIVVPNGIDTDRFRPLREEGVLTRKEWKVEPQELLIGLVARLDPMKDHPTFLRAATILVKERNNVKFVCVGDGQESYKQELFRLAINSGLEGRIIWAGARKDMPSVYNAFDVAVLSSYGEGFPNVVGEAMACDVPCVVTNVGDSALIVGETGVVVKPQDANALASGIERMLSKLEQAGAKEPFMARKRIYEYFSVESMVSQTERALFCIQ